MVSVFAGNHSASRRGFLRLSRVPPTSRVFASGYVNTETILHFFNIWGKKKSVCSYSVLGYNPVITIPAGATNVNITEIRRSKNYLGELLAY